MEQELQDKYFNSQGQARYTQISIEQFLQLVKNPSERTNGMATKMVERSSENSWVIRNYRLDDQYIVFDSSCNSTWKITFENCYFEKTVNFDDVVFSKNISFKECFFDETVYFSNCEFQNLDIQECHFKKQVYFSSGKFKEIKFSQHDTKELTIARISFTKFQLGYYIGSTTLNKLVIINNNKENGPIEISGVEQINEFNIFGPIYGNLQIEDIRSRKFSLVNFTCHSDFKVSGLKSTKDKDGTHFSILNSNLNKSEFYRLDLKSFNEVNIADSNLLGCIFINTLWPENIFAFTSPKIGLTDFRKNDDEANTDEFRSQQRETYRQLKIVLGKQGDNVQEQLFYSKEMNIYNDELKWTPLFKTSFWDKLILNFSRSFSDYGTNFGKALRWFLLINFVVTILLIKFYNIENLYISWEDSSWTAFWEATKLFLNQLNPLHKFDQSLPGHAVLLDLVGRIFSSYLIYHLIRTSRRFVR
ncbi:MAG: pentapeptide repeat-containing protein [Fluviicola sp.]|nr:pentapeptide repeat-containing protein [Fluviicola sp.]